MCGIQATFTARNYGFYKQDVDNFMSMFLLTSLRGLDSTGMAGLNLRNPDAEASLVKIVGNPFYLYDFEHTKEFNRRFLSEFTGVIGHCRAATKGEVNAKNAHPFRHGTVTLVHNGTLTNFDELRKKYDKPKIEVDSELICSLFNEYDVKEVIEELEGAFTLVWFDEADMTFNYVRNYQRPLFIATDKTTQTIVLASEKATLEWSKSKHNFNFSSIESVDAYKWYKYTVGSLEPEITQISLPVIQTTPAYHGGYGARTYTYDNDLDEWVTGGDQSVTTKSVDGDSCSIDNHLANKYADGTEDLERGMMVLADIVDYDYKPILNGEITTFIGSSKDYPRTTFQATFVRRVDESEFYEGNVKLQGEVHRIRTEYSSKGLPQDTVILIKPKLVTLVEGYADENGSDQFEVETYYGSVLLTRQRIEHLIKNTKCEWCQLPHKPFTEKSVKDLIYVSSEASADGSEGLVCTTCSINSRISHNRH